KDIKEKIAEHQKLPINYYNIYFNNKLLHENDLIIDCDIKNICILLEAKLVEEIPEEDKNNVPYNTSCNICMLPKLLFTVPSCHKSHEYCIDCDNKLYNKFECYICRKKIESFNYIMHIFDKELNMNKNSKIVIDIDYFTGW